MTGAPHTISISHRTADAHASDQSITDEEDSAGVHIGRSHATSRQQSEGEYSEESTEEGYEEEEEEEDTWTDLSKDLGPSQSASRPASSAHHRIVETRHPVRRVEDDRLPHRPRQAPRQARRRSPTPPGSVDSAEDPYAGSAADLAIRQGAGSYYTFTPQQAVQSQPYTQYRQASPGYAPYQQQGMSQQHMMPYGQQQQVQYPYSPYQQHPHGGSQYPFPSQPRMASGYGAEVAYPQPAPYNPYMTYPMQPQAIPQPIHYHYPPVYTPPPPNPTPPAQAAAAAVVAAADTDAYEDFKKMLLADKADREAREAAAKAAEEQKRAELEAAKKHAEALTKAAEAAAADAKTEAEKKAAEEQKKLKAEAEEAAAKAKADAEAAAKKYEEEKEAAVKAAAAAAAVPAEKQKPIKFKDAVGRKFSFPFHLCKTWEGMEDLIRQAFLHVDVIGPHVVEGHYDLIGPNNEIILPGVWETVIEPDWTITMHMWPVPEKEEMDIIEVPPLGPEIIIEDKKKVGKKPVKKGGGGFLFFGGGAPKAKSKGKASIAAAAAAAAAGKK